MGAFLGMGHGLGRALRKQRRFRQAGIAYLLFGTLVARLDWFWWRLFSERDEWIREDNLSLLIVVGLPAILALWWIGCGLRFCLKSV